MSPEQAAIVDAMMLRGGGSRQSSYSPPPPPVQKPETWLERQRREAMEMKMRMIDAQAQ